MQANSINRSVPKVLAIVNHYYGKSRGFVGKSSNQDADTRRKIVMRAIDELRTIPNIDIKVCGMNKFSLVDINIDFSNIDDPTHLIYESIEWMSSQVDKYDYFINMEDDILLKKETFEKILDFDKKNLINECFHPNRMEYDGGREYCVDLEAVPGWTDVLKKYAGIELRVALNPHSGIAILSREKLLYAKKHVNFKRRERIIGHFMESAFANLHSPFLLFRAYSNLFANKIIHLDNWDSKGAQEIINQKNMEFKSSPYYFYKKRIKKYIPRCVFKEIINPILNKLNSKKNVQEVQTNQVIIEKIKFPESKLAHKYLDGLEGLEIGGSAHNPFGLNTKNVDFTDDITKFKQSELDLVGKILPIDVIAPGDAIPLPDESQDFILSSHVLEHFPDPIKALREWYRIVKSGGYIFMIIPHKERTFDRDKERTTLQELIRRYKTKIYPSAPLDDHYSVWITEDIVELVEYFGWQIVEVRDVDDKVGNGFTIVIQK